MLWIGRSVVTMAYDIIGDIHGCARTLEALLQEKLGYSPVDGSYRHPERSVIFLGDFINGGPHQRRTVERVRAMLKRGDALAVMGHHEFDGWRVPQCSRRFRRSSARLPQVRPVRHTNPVSIPDRPVRIRRIGWRPWPCGYFKTEPSLGLCERQLSARLEVGKTGNDRPHKCTLLLDRLVVAH